MRKKGLDFNFTWIFAIIAGAVILFLAIYAASSFIDTEKYQQNTQTSAQLSILLNPLETSLESGKSSKISFSDETKLFNKCENSGNFGEQRISVAVSSGIGENKNPGGGTRLYNKYIFSKNTETGKEFFVFTKPFEMPFKIADLMFFSGERYCFVQAPTEIKDEVTALNLNRIEIANKTKECSKESTSVCFNSACNISVYGNSGKFDSGYILKNGKKMYFAGSLIYAAIFSSPEIYDCNFKRLMLRTISLCQIYKDKINLLNSKGVCGSMMEPELSSMINIARDINSSQISRLKIQADEINSINDASVCRIF